MGAVHLRGLLLKGMASGADLFVLRMTLTGDGSCSMIDWDAMLPVRDSEVLSDPGALPEEVARGCLAEGRPRVAAFGVCSPAAAPQRTPE